MNYEFDIDQWLPRFPLSSAEKYDRYSAEIITSPSDLCINEQLRACVHDQFDWGPDEPVDIFVMAEGEPQDRHVTKIGGVPYRPAGLRWPVGPDGNNAVFLGQFCFAQSHDIVGELPGDVLLVFGILPNEGEDYAEEVRFEWYPLGLSELIKPADVPSQSWRFEPCFGYRYRTKSFPFADARDQQSKYARCNGHDIWSDFHLLQYQATQIGRAPFFIQSNAMEMPGCPLCALSSVQPSSDTPFPFINRPVPIPLDDFPHRKWLMIGDMGCLYISIDEHGRLHHCWDCY